MILVLLLLLVIVGPAVVVLGVQGRGRGRLLPESVDDSPGATCATCGVPVVAGVSFCGSCGAPVTGQEASTALADTDGPEQRVWPVVGGAAVVLFVLGIVPGVLGLAYDLRVFDDLLFVPWGWGTSLVFGRHLSPVGFVALFLSVVVSVLALVLALMRFAWVQGLTRSRYRALRILQWLLLGGVVLYLGIWRFGSSGGYWSGPNYYDGGRGMGFLLIALLLGATVCASLPPVRAPRRDRQAPAVRALTPTVDEDGSSRCPYCREQVRPDALVCKHCSARFAGHPAGAGLAGAMGQAGVVDDARSYAVASLVLSLVGCGVGAVLGVVFGHLALGRIKQSGVETSRGMALAGVILGWVEIGSLVLLLAFYVGFLGAL